MQGLVVNGDPIIDPISKDTTVYPLYGDPNVGTGWYEGPGWPGREDDDGGDRYISINSGSLLTIIINSECLIISLKSSVIN